MLGLVIVLPLGKGWGDLKYREKIETSIQHFQVLVTQRKNSETDKVRNCEVLLQVHTQEGVTWPRILDSVLWANSNGKKAYS
jgi:hypothetical protein